MTDEQIRQALAVCEKRTQAQRVCEERTPGPWDHDDNAFLVADLAYIAATTDPETGYKATLRELHAIRAGFCEVHIPTKVAPLNVCPCCAAAHERERLSVAVRLLRIVPCAQSHGDDGLRDCKCPSCLWHRERRAFLDGVK